MINTQEHNCHLKHVSTNKVVSIANIKFKTVSHHIAAVLASSGRKIISLSVGRVYLRSY